MTGAKRFMTPTSLFMFAAVNIAEIALPSRVEEFLKDLDDFPCGILPLYFSPNITQSQKERYRKLSRVHLPA
jgi:hypothetical protein